MLKELTLTGEIDKVEVAMARLRLHEKEALRLNQEGYYVAFSGGKDSCVVLDLCKRAGVKFTAHYNLTTVDPPEVVQFIRHEYPEVIKELPEKTMWQMIEEKGIFPMRQARYCCKELKERGGKGHYVVTGIRWQESARRKKRKLVEPCRTGQHGKMFLHPIIDWSDAEVWEYIRTYNVKYCKLYDEGFKRIGCVFCPFGSKAEKEMWLKRYPQIAKAYIAAMDRALVKREKEGKKIMWRSGKECFEWWITGKRAEKIDMGDEEPKEINLFGLMCDESYL